MSLPQFGLFFVALLIGYVLLHLRLVRFEQYLRELAGVRLLNERLQQMADSLERSAARSDSGPRFEEVCAELRALREAVGRLERVAGEVRLSAGPPPAPRESAQERIRSLVETRLASLGYGRVRIVTDLSGADPNDELDIAVECDRNQVAHKGRVLTAQGVIRDVRLHSVTQSFP